MAALARFLAFPMREQARVVEAVLCLLVSRLALGLLPLPTALRLLRIVQGKAGSGRVVASEAGDIALAVTRAARHVPFRAVCLQQAFAALLMLRRRGLAASVQFGLMREVGTGELKAHAWSHCGEVPVTGVAAAHGFTPVAIFGS
jgi:hypothetical protein